MIDARTSQSPSFLDEKKLIVSNFVSPHNLKLQISLPPYIYFYLKRTVFFSIFAAPATLFKLNSNPVLAALPDTLKEWSDTHPFKQPWNASSRQMIHEWVRLPVRMLLISSPTLGEETHENRVISHLWRPLDGTVFTLTFCPFTIIWVTFWGDSRLNLGTSEWNKRSNLRKQRVLKPHGFVGGVSPPKSDMLRVHLEDGISKNSCGQSYLTVSQFIVMLEVSLWLSLNWTRESTGSARVGGGVECVREASSSIVSPVFIQEDWEYILSLALL